MEQTELTVNLANILTATNAVLHKKTIHTSSEGGLHAPFKLVCETTFKYVDEYENYPHIKRDTQGENVFKGRPSSMPIPHKTRRCIFTTLNPISPTLCIL